MIHSDVNVASVILCNSIRTEAEEKKLKITILLYCPGLLRLKNILSCEVAKRVLERKCIFFSRRPC